MLTLPQFAVAAVSGDVIKQRLQLAIHELEIVQNSPFKGKRCYHVGVAKGILTLVSEDMKSCPECQSAIDSIKTVVSTVDAFAESCDAFFAYPR